MPPILHSSSCAPSSAPFFSPTWWDGVQILIILCCRILFFACPNASILVEYVVFPLIFLVVGLFTAICEVDLDLHFDSHPFFAVLVWFALSILSCAQVSVAPSGANVAFVIPAQIALTALVISARVGHHGPRMPRFPLG